MSWIQVSATIDSAVADRSPYIDLFVDYGIENTIEINGSITGCLANVSGSLEQVQKLAYALRKMGALDVELSDLPEVNWEESWKQFFKIRRVGERFVIRPSWEPYEAEPNDLVIELDPGQAFGTGDHPTTAKSIARQAGRLRAGARCAPAPLPPQLFRSQPRPVAAAVQACQGFNGP